MSHLLFWPSQYYFYPIGNTVAISLTGDLPWEETANILLLGCGDPRNILHTIFSEPDQSTRILDFTCCDYDPAVLARNVILLSMIVDDIPIDVLWNTFFHFRIDEKSRSVLIKQCNKLLDLSATPMEWRSSRYGSYIRMCTNYTLLEVRRHWQLYVNMKDLPISRKEAIESAFTRLMQDNAERGNASILRSAAPLIAQAVPGLQSYSIFWNSGTTFLDSNRQGEATELNPTFVYSLGGEGCALHYGTDPLVPFHLAPCIANFRGTLSIGGMTQAAREEFAAWCSAYRSSITSAYQPIIRLFVGEATAVCHTLRSYHSTGASSVGLPVAQWNTTSIRLSQEEYTASANSAPSSFNVIHTSNLEDHLGLFNVIISVAPLLSRSPFSVIYTESLLHVEKNATKEFAENMKGDISVVAMLTGIVPVDYLCGFSSRSNTHEILMHRALNQDKNRVTQFHQVTTWKTPTSGDFATAPLLDNILHPSFDPYQLGTFLYDVHQSLFEIENVKKFLEANQNTLMRAVSASNLAHYTRETFVLFLKLVRRHLKPSDDSWVAVMDRFEALREAASSIKNMDALHYQDLCGQLLRHGVYRAHWLHDKAKKIGPFSAWDAVPDLVRIVLVIPRQDLRALEDIKPENIGTPILQCDIHGIKFQNIFNSVHVAFGRAIRVGGDARPGVVFEEDTKGWKGASSLVASFIVPAHSLVQSEPPSELIVSLCFRCTPAAIMALRHLNLGVSLRISSAKLMDTSRVFILPESSRSCLDYPPAIPHTAPNLATDQIGTSSTSSIDFDEQCELIATLTARISLTDPEAIKEFCSVGSKAVPVISQPSPCVIQVKLGTKSQNLPFPLPVQITGHRVRLARKSQYIEIVVLPSRSLLPDGMKLNPFPVISMNNMIQPWSIHRLNIDKLPVLDLESDKIKPWLDPHVASMLSNREQAARRKHKVDALMFVKDTIHSLFVRVARTQGRPARAFSFIDRQTKNCDTIVFVNEIRFDVASHTIVCDGYVLPLSERLLADVSGPFKKLLQAGDMGNISIFEGELHSWKQLFPALVERCRVSWNHGPNCEYISSSRIPLTEQSDENPLCSCGVGKDVEGMHKNPIWKPFAPYVTRVAISPLFAVSYLETVCRSPDNHKCAACRGKGTPRLKECTGCKRVRYCSPECQKKDWKSHKPKCQNK